MFELYYRVVHSEYDDFVGQNGFFQITNIRPIYNWFGVFSSNSSDMI